MTLLEGSLLQREPLTAPIFLELLAAIGELHARGIVYGSIGKQKIFLERSAGNTRGVWLEPGLPYVPECWSETEARYRADNYVPPVLGPSELGSAATASTDVHGLTTLLFARTFPSRSARSCAPVSRVRWHVARRMPA